MNIREATKEEAKKVLVYYKQETQDDYEGHRIGIIENYISDCPGYCGKLYFVVGGFINAYSLLAENEAGELKSVEQDCVIT